eukprot:CAMPEP_0183392400 /NCGR_PEP_ID=MMETSP0370-20130417/7129_1 /TAXON_ID=268820 /ORGANISM="Peridinium aciculiferum, Strain PAER-2" /LENGTH=60 /DNA_ID=CAMNT_0025572329 /DNA_START=251 /DNA_END=433 /DNA_ORIENTATION=+
MPLKGKKKPPLVRTHEAKDVKKHHDPASIAGWTGALSRAKTPNPGGAKTKPKTPPATAPL